MATRKAERDECCYDNGFISNHRQHQHLDQHHEHRSIATTTLIYFPFLAVLFIALGMRDACALCHWQVPAVTRRPISGHFSRYYVQIIVADCRMSFTADRHLISIHNNNT